MGERITVYIADLDTAALLSEGYCREHFPVRYEKAIRFKHNADRLRSVAAGYLLYEVLNLNESELAFGVHGKPYIPGKQCFSLSHSGSYAVLAESNDIIGVDLEQISSHRNGIARRVFTPDELKWLNAEPQTRFSVLWTLKEAVSKAVGKGLSIGFNRFSVLPLISGSAIYVDEFKLYGLTIAYEEYALSLVSARQYSDIVVKRM